MNNISGFLRSRSWRFKPNAPSAKRGQQAANYPLTGLRSYKNLPSKTKPIMSDKDFITTAIEQAKKDFAQGVYQSAEYWSLEAAYTNVVAPDRVGAINNQFYSLFPGGSPRYPNTPNVLTEVKIGATTVADYSQLYGWRPHTTKA